MDRSKRFLDALRRGGYRITSQRQAVCEYLANTDDHPTPSEVFTAVRRAYPEISRATVYNTLNALRDLGAIVEISTGGEHTHYDTDPDPHVNLVCLRCGRVIDYTGGVSPEVFEETVYTETGFQPVTVQVQVVGFCAACQQAKREEIRRQLQQDPEQADQ